jgi:tetratricopeptide (TPR) repeat protein
MDSTENSKAGAEDCLAKGKVAYENNRLDEAIAWFTRSIEQNPMDAVYDFRGCAYLQKKEFDKAIADHSRAIELCSPADKTGLSKTYYNRALDYMGKDDQGKALIDTRKAIEYNLANKYAQKLHGYITRNPLPYGFGNPQAIKNILGIEQPTQTESHKQKLDEEWRCTSCGRNVKILRIDLYKTDIGLLCASCCMQTGRHHFIKNEFRHPRPLTKQEIAQQNQITLKGMCLILMFFVIGYFFVTMFFHGTGHRVLGAIIYLSLFVVVANIYKNWASRQ